jgi:hypothetical protein
MPVLARNLERVSIRFDPPKPLQLGNREVLALLLANLLNSVSYRI